MCAPSVLPKSIRPPVGWLLVINMNFKASKALRSCSARVSLPAASSVCPERLQGANRPSVWQINDVTILRFFDTLETVNSVNSLNKRQIYAFKLFFPRISSHTLCLSKSLSVKALRRAAWRPDFADWNVSSRKISTFDAVAFMMLVEHHSEKLKIRTSFWNDFFIQNLQAAGVCRRSTAT